MMHKRPSHARKYIWLWIIIYGLLVVAPATVKYSFTLGGLLSLLAIAVLIQTAVIDTDNGS